MAVQNLPTFYNFKYTDKDGNMTSDSLLFNDQTYQALNIVVSLLNKISSTVVNQGSVTVNAIVAPTLAADPAIQPADPNGVPIGGIWYNSTANMLKFNSNTGIQTITST